MASYETMQLIINELMINPNLSGRQLGKRLGMSHTTIGNYLNRVKLSGKTVKELYAMPPGDLKATLQLTGERFTEPEDYLAVVKYMHPPRSYGNNGAHNITEAYTNLYLMKVTGRYSPPTKKKWPTVLWPHPFKGEALRSYSSDKAISCRLY